jgi:hypothetical protein
MYGWSAKDGQAHKTNGYCSTVSIGLAKLIDIKRRDIFSSASDTE